MLGHMIKGEKKKTRDANLFKANLKAINQPGNAKRDGISSSVKEYPAKNKDLLIISQSDEMDFESEVWWYAHCCVV